MSKLHLYEHKLLVFTDLYFHLQKFEQNNLCFQARNEAKYLLTLQF